MLLFGHFVLCKNLYLKAGDLAHLRLELIQVPEELMAWHVVDMPSKPQSTCILAPDTRMVEVNFFRLAFGPGFQLLYNHGTALGLLRRCIKFFKRTIYLLIAIEKYSMGSLN